MKYLASMIGIKQLSDRENTKSITFRLPKRILEQIELEAGQNNVSENVLVKQILTNYVDWFRLSKGTGMIPISKESFQMLTQNLDGTSIYDIVENIHLMIKNFGLIRYGRYDLKTAIESLSMYVQMSNFQLVHLKEENSHRFLITHSLGISWSLVLEQLINATFGEFIDPSQIKFKTTDDSIIASVTLPSLD
ncbi:hypothetical protein QVH35_08045 [Candidatus Nitrosotenuis chungbukensis]|uniref:hypothetical protein n=1 Tax=Candidatus Nitrosotenuis chungbukensis TaxID=1353246 RepID=UPI0005B26548|nr:hypothetical protein [Candidatus Nitrosotenuis chungbukensis]WKT57348.1 hypothetical protein QVH35_08045 [Candidatus Nitrosotenuis chungbukensis]